MSGILLDTNALLWLWTDPDRISPAAMDVLGDSASPAFVSAASAWEIAIKTRSGRFDGHSMLSAWDESLAAMMLVGLPIDASDAIAAGGLSWAHRDPFDRMIVAQAVRRGLTIATSDQVMLADAPTPVLDTRA
ncbi:MAG: type II toxin-antitoxin system VapC family toxin [Gordonia sp. (in: high G+C Gram-positive bacteria)]|uniref:type II toxin-antitoxin system VapC family toxin n=1 Tax=Gordonia sp. (in: high G+C Gram-positive bacteria) TaxID=84139 RepID=UPI003BB5B6E3